MNDRHVSRAWFASVAMLTLASPAEPGMAAGAESTYASLKGEIVLDNERVVVEKFVIAPGQGTGRHTPHGDQLAVFVHGGVLTSRTDGRSVLWRDGRVAWQGAAARADDGSVNSGSAPIELLWVTLKPAGSAVSVTSSSEDRHLSYPNIPGEDIFENDLVIVQRFTVAPGQWEGVHAHGPNMLYIHVRGGQWAARSKREGEHVNPTASPDGKVGWMAPIDIHEGHESGNVGSAPIDLIWVTLKN